MRECVLSVHASQVGWHVVTQGKRRQQPIRWCGLTRERRRTPLCAVQQVWAAITCHLERNLDVQRMRREAGTWAVAMSRFGVAARAVVFALLGWTIIAAGWSRNAGEVGTTASSLRTLAEQPGDVGTWLLGITAAGLIAYGFYEIVHARYLRIRRLG